MDDRRRMDGGGGVTAMVRGCDSAGKIALNLFDDVELKVRELSRPCDVNRLRKRRGREQKSENEKAFRDVLVEGLARGRMACV
jgi:hypothetical protein